VDIVPELATVTQGLYSGGLGYFVVNLPEDWEGEFRRSEFFTQLVEYITDRAPAAEDINEEGDFEILRQAPVTVARPRVTDKDVFKARVSQYFGFNTPSYETIAQADTAFLNLLRSERLAQVALTEKQKRGEESSRHYNWKGIVVEGVARQYWVSKTEKEISFSKFLKRDLIGNGPICTEKPIPSPDIDKASAVADIYLESDDLTQSTGKFVEDVEVELPVSIEFETGFGEGAFQHRKVLDSIKKYEDIDDVASVLLVVPPRLLYRGERQARLLNKFAESAGDELNISPSVCVPLLSEGKCIGLREAKKVTQVLYDND
jgi:hypothetical protein